MIQFFALSAAFNLVCSGTVEVGPLLKKHYSYETVYRVDLDANRWCSGDCVGTSSIHKQTDTMLVLVRESQDSLSGYRQYQDAFERLTGEHVRFEVTGRGAATRVVRWRGKCERQAFTGFPKLDPVF